MRFPFPPLLALGAFVTSASFAAPSSADPWAAGLTLDYAAVDAGLAVLHASKPEDLNAQLAYASSLLMKQPRSNGNLRTALDLSAEVLTRPTATTDQRVLARYLLARIYHIHLDAPELDHAATEYRKLLADFPGHPLAEQAAVKLALLYLYQSPNLAPPDAQKHVADLLARVTTADARRELHFLLGKEIWLAAHDPANALQHLIAARELDFQQLDRNAEVDLMIGNIARENGRPDLALPHLRRFLAQRERDPRVTTVRRYVRQLESLAANDQR